MKIGDVIRLPSGSSAMTVCKINVEDVEICWMGYNDHILHRDKLPMAVFQSDAAASNDKQDISF